MNDEETKAWRAEAAKAMDARLKRGWTPIDVTEMKLWYFPSERRLWQEVGTPMEIYAVIKAHEDAIRVLQSGCPECLAGYADIMVDNMDHCDLCDDTGFPVFRWT